MRTTLAIDDDVLEAARALADRRRESVGKVVSDLARASLSASASASNPKAGSALPRLPDREGASPVTLALVNRLRDQGA